MRAAMTHPADVLAGAEAPPGARRPWAVAADNALGHLVEIPAAILVVAEIVILFSGIVARYALHEPLVWSDELASILFLWLAMLGAVVAFRRGEHMRMGALVNRASPAARAVLDMVAVAAALAFLLMLQAPGFEYASEERYVTTAALEIPNVWRAAALPVGTALMALIALLRLVERTQWRTAGLALLLVGGVVAAMAALQPVFASLGNLNLLIFFVGIVAATVLAGVPIAFSFGLATFGYLSLTTDVPMMVVVGRMDEGMSHLILLAVPLFVFLGVLIEMTGMAKRMVAFLASLLGHVRGGLSYVLIGAMYVVSGISGAKAADMAAVAPVLFPEMRERGADEGDLVALLSATGAQTETVPPSLVLITIGSVTGVSITALFTGGLLPGLVLGVMLCLVVWWRNRREDLSTVRKASGRQIGRALLVALPALALPFVIRAAVVEGVATATEVSTIGIVYATLVGLLVYRCFDPKRLKPMLVDTACLSGAILLIIGTATGMAWALTQSGFSTQLATTMAGLPGGAATFMAVSIVAFVILGSVLEGIPAIVLFGPLLFPIAHQMGIHEVHYAMVVILSMGLGLFAPPFGVGYYAACAIGRVAPEAGIRPIMGYLSSLAVGIVVIAAVPWLSTGFLK
ncbi:Sialic acid TRAP transporter permease protein SiaT [Achromobacter denitrificans]|nr:TRAP transporter large permease subunit [Achromobacter denitrificans]OLU08941.1 ABC transporter permease [Achromobacter denitrificans]QKH40604.1 TRAP transporter large permease subunit [Achromobacter denitrificans]QKH52251.1 TRAP transporter large permease subunit [Achromobacter denitrificans]CAB3705373.1 Sialic acid TRAP transporter permease protein SiaT [Achromobacter denitrificans]